MAVLIEVFSATTCRSHVAHPAFQHDDSSNGVWTALTGIQAYGDPMVPVGHAIHQMRVGPNLM